MGKKFFAKLPAPLQPIFFLPLFLWTAAFAFSLWHCIADVEERTIDMARVQARTAIERDIAYCLWNAKHGGVMVPIIPGKVEPDPYLSRHGRDLLTTDADAFTKINPMSMIRASYENALLRTSVVEGRIISHTPINRKNTPDPWESSSLRLLESGLVEEVSSVEILRDKPYLRLIRPMQAGKNCISCHASQRYRVGHVMGALSAATPMPSFYSQFASTRASLYATHFSLWLLGLGGMGYSFSRIISNIRKRSRVEDRLRTEVRQRIGLEKMLREAATTDSLTRLLNRNSMLERLSLEVVRHTRSHTVFSLLMADIDHFKKVNDNRGHDAGDQVLMEISEILKKSLRAQDAVARWGGEEFLIMLPETELASAYLVGDKIRKQIKAISLGAPEDTFNVTISIGVAEFRPDQDISCSIKRADNALYQAKKKGRNRVEMAVPESAPVCS